MLISILMLLIILCNLFYENVYINNFSYILAILIYSVLYFREKRFFLRFFPLLFSILFYLTGILVNENYSLYLKELGSRSKFVGSLPLAVLAHTLCVITCYLLYKNGEKKWKKIKKNKNVYLKILNKTYIILLLLIFIMIIFFEKPIWNYYGLDRFLYLKQMKQPIIAKSMNILYYFLGIIVYLSYFSNTAKISVVLYLMIYIMMGHKFGVLQSVFYIFSLLGSVVLKDIKIKEYIKKIMFLSGICICFATSYSYFIGIIDKPDHYLTERLSQQGQIWAKVFLKKDYSLTFNKDYIEKEIDTFFKIKLEKNILQEASTYQMMKLVTRKDIYIRKIRRESRYAGTTQASILFQYNWIILCLVQILLGIIYYYILTNLVNTYENLNLENILKNILYMRLFFIIRPVYEQSDFYKLFSLEVIIIILLLLFINIVKEKREERILC